MNSTPKIQKSSRNITRWLSSQKGTHSPQRRKACQGSHIAGGLKQHQRTVLSLKAQDNPWSVHHDYAANTDKLAVTESFSFSSMYWMCSSTLPLRAQHNNTWWTILRRNYPTLSKISVTGKKHGSNDLKFIQNSSVSASIPTSVTLYVPTLKTPYCLKSKADWQQTVHQNNYRKVRSLHYNRRQWDEICYEFFIWL